MHKQGRKVIPKTLRALSLLLVLSTVCLALDYSDTPQIGQAFEALLPKLKRRRIHVQKSAKVEQTSVYSSRAYTVTSNKGSNTDFENDDTNLIENINIYDPQVVYQAKYGSQTTHVIPSADHTKPQIVAIPAYHLPNVEVNTVIHQQVHQVPIVQPVVVRPAIVQPEPHVVVVSEQHSQQTVTQHGANVVVSHVHTQHHEAISQTPPQNPYGVSMKESELDKLLEANGQQVLSPQGVGAGVPESTQSPIRALAQTSLSSNSRLTSKRGQLKASAGRKLINLALVSSASEGLHTVTKRSQLSAKQASEPFTKLAKVKTEQRSWNGHRLSSNKGSLDSRPVAGTINLAEASSSTIGLQAKPTLSGGVNLARSSSEASVNSNLRGQLGDHTAAQVSASQKLLSRGKLSSAAGSHSEHQNSVTSAASAKASASVAATAASTQQGAQKSGSTAAATGTQGLVRPSPLEHAPPVDELDDLDDEPTASPIVSLARTEKSGLAAMKTVGDLRSASYITSFASVKEAEDEGLLNSVQF